MKIIYFPNTLTQLPFSKVHVQDVVGRVDDRSNLDINELNKADDEINDRYDQSLLNNIDPDINFIVRHLIRLVTGHYLGNLLIDVCHYI